MPGVPKKCEECKVTRASCGIPGERPTHCGKCKKDGMMNLTRERCVECKTTIPSYGIEGKKPSHCVKCKKEGMIHLGEKCKDCNKKQCYYNYEGMKAKYCVECKKENMIDVRSSKCIICKVKQPTFKNITSKLATHCGDCKEEDMFDCKSKMCEKCKKKNPIYGYEKITHCLDCKEERMVDLKNKKCIVCNKHQASYSKEIGIPASHCKSCKPESLIDVKHKQCKNNSCDVRGNTKYRGYCSWCFQHLFPDNPLSKQIRNKTYESEVAIAVLERDKEYKHDKPMFLGGCDCSVRRRVDFWKIIGNTVLAIEVDEEQHKQYNSKEEELRYDDLYMAFSGKWIFIRFNPNNFKDVSGKLNRMRLKDKLPTLLEEIEKHEERIQKEQNLELLEIHRLFFDE